MCKDHSKTTNSCLFDVKLKHFNIFMIKTLSLNLTMVGCHLYNIWCLLMSSSQTNRIGNNGNIGMTGFATRIQKN